MKTASVWLKTVAKATLPAPTRRWIRGQGEGVASAMRRTLVRKMEFRNREGYENYHFVLLSAHSKKGTTALMRVKNEESKIYFSLRSILDVFDEIVLIDNGSTDRTVEIARVVKEEMDREDKIRIFCYPFTIAKCGAEHSRTPEDSVHSLTYYYNWSLSKCSLRYVCKWDGDMVLQRASKVTFKEYLGPSLMRGRKLWIVEGQTVYRDAEKNLWLAIGEVNREPMLFPYGYNPRFFKTALYEMLAAHPPLPTGVMRGVLFFELKFADEDEFSHWSNSEIPTQRKRRELENFALVRDGKIDLSRFERLPVDFLDRQLE